MDKQEEVQLWHAPVQLLSGGDMTWIFRLFQGCMFWEHTPASSVTLQPSVLPSSLQQCTQAHPRLLQNLLWAVPKVKFEQVIERFYAVRVINC